MLLLLLPLLQHCEQLGPKTMVAQRTSILSLLVSM
jgi:hypothetical protein